MLPRNIVFGFLVMILNLLVSQQQLLLLLCIRRFQLLQTASLLQIELLNQRRRHRRRFRPYWVFPRPAESWFEVHLNIQNFPVDFFRCHLRMRRNMFDGLLVAMRPFIQRQNTRFRDCVPAEKVLAIGLYRIAHGGSYINTGLAMNVGKGTVYEAFYDVINGLYELRFDYIKLPETMAETRASIETFTHLSDLPNIAGAVDGSHIRIKAPKDSPADYFRRYHQYDVIIQGIVDGRKLFIDVAAGFPGKLHDARVCRNSPIYRKAENGDILTEPLYQVGNRQIKPYLVGDSAYPHSPWLQKPYPEGTTDPSEIQFNKQLSSARVTVECAFGILKGRWRILDYIEEGNMSVISKIIIACCALQNFCILAGDEWDDDELEDNDPDNRDNNNDILADGDAIRELLKDYL